MILWFIILVAYSIDYCPTNTLTKTRVVSTPAAILCQIILAIHSAMLILDLEQGWVKLAVVANSMFILVIPIGIIMLIDAVGESGREDYLLLEEMTQ